MLGHCTGTVKATSWTYRHKVSNESDRRVVGARIRKAETRRLWPHSEARHRPPSAVWPGRSVRKSYRPGSKWRCWPTHSEVNAFICIYMYVGSIVYNSHNFFFFFHFSLIRVCFFIDCFSSYWFNPFEGQFYSTNN